jgi:hypothetical protein
MIASSSLVAVPGPQNSSIGSSAGWAGYVLNQPGVTYDFVEGTWIVPTISPTPPTNDSDFMYSLWVGLDGTLGSYDVVQDGERGKMTKIPPYNIWVRFHFAWIEYYPLAFAQISSLSVHDGDTMFAQAWVGDAAGNINASGGYGWFFLENVTTQTSYRGSVQKPNGTTFVGNCAEWILERPGIGNLPPLANYQHATMFNMFSYVSNDGNVSPHYLATDANWNLTLKDPNLNYVLTTVQQQGNYQEYFTWVAAK